MAVGDVQTAEASDRLWACRELKQEVIAFFQHKERLEGELAQLFEERKISEECLADAQSHLRSPPTFHRLVLQITEMSGDLFEKKGIYSLGRSKTGYINTMLAVQRDPAVKGDLIRSVGEELRELEEMIQSELRISNESDEAMKDGCEQLRMFMEEARQRLIRAVQMEQVRDS
jgi:hypothetical protein